MEKKKWKWKFEGNKPRNVKKSGEGIDRKIWETTYGN